VVQSPLIFIGSGLGVWVGFSADVGVTVALVSVDEVGVFESTGSVGVCVGRIGVAGLQAEKEVAARRVMIMRKQNLFIFQPLYKKTILVEQILIFCKVSHIPGICYQSADNMDHCKWKDEIKIQVTSKRFPCSFITYPATI
jgi:hypothetical protein